MAKSLEGRVAELEERVAYLEGEVGLSLELSRLSRMCDTGLPWGQAKIVLALYLAHGRTLSVFQLADATGQTPGTIKVTVCRARAVCPHLRTDRAAGYSLSPAGLHWVENALVAISGAAPCAQSS